MFLLPYPKKINFTEGFLKSKVLKINNICSDERIEKALRFFKTGNDDVVLTVETKNGEGEGYSLSISEDRIHIEGNSAGGVFYAIQTLRQIFESEQVRCLEIEDEPDMNTRGFYHDVTRGKIPTVERLKKLIDTMAYYKMNSLQLYVEHVFPFKELGDLVHKTSHLTPDEIKELDDYCYENFIEFVPSIATFGHLYELLQTESYKHLRCLEEFNVERIFWAERMDHHTIDPSKKESFQVICSLIDQYLPLFRTNKFNICCDETYDLKKENKSDEEIGKLYVDFVKKIISHLESRGKTVMMWGDIVLKHPEIIEQLKDRVTFLNWWYSAEPIEENVKVFSELNCKQIVCPGTNSWSRLVENVNVADKNIEKLLDYGHKYNALGMLNTNWGDHGNPCSLEMSVHGLVLGAAKSWNILTAPDKKFKDSLNNLEYRNEKAVKYLTMLDDAHKKIIWNNLTFLYSNLIYDKKFEFEYPSMDDIEYSVSVAQSVVKELSGQIWEREEYRSEMLIAAEGITVMAELFGKFAQYRIERVSDTKEWLKKYRESWVKYNKESELCEIEKMFVFLENA